jgi:hypothetical protein
MCIAGCNDVPTPITAAANRRATRLGALITLAGAASCGREPLPNEGAVAAYLQDPTSARASLVASLVNPANGYSQLRLAHYATGEAGDWDGLPEWNPPAERIAASELDGPGGAPTDRLGPNARSLLLPDTTPSEDNPALLALGAAAFFGYPMQIVPALRVALASRESAARYGLWVDASRGVGGLVRARMADGSVALAATCATCHAGRAADGTLSAGLPASTLDVGAAILAYEGLPPSLAGDARASWGPGRVDVTTDTGVEPVRIADLRAVRWLSYLQQDATVRARDVVALAIRIETLIITSSAATVRPPRVLALALATYVRSLASTLPPVDSANAASPRGAAVFAARCARCHEPPALSGPPVALDVVGTDPTFGLSADRGTGTYRVPSLHGVGDRGPLLHDGTVPCLEALFDPARQAASYPSRLHGQGAIPGHSFGLDLATADRDALVTFLRAL